MPTGYTARLENMDFDVRRWLEVEIPRAFGMMIDLRDTNIPDDVVPTDLIQMIRDKSTAGYYEEILAQAKTDLARLEARQPKMWIQVFETERIKDERLLQERVLSKEKLRTSYQVAIDKVAKLLEPSGDVNHNIVKMAHEQLILGMDTYTPELDKIWAEGSEAWKEHELKAAREHIVYAEKSLKKEKDRTKERLQYYEDWLKFLEKHF